MSVIIKDMDIPATCKDCPFVNKFDNPYYDCRECDQDNSPYCTWKPDVVNVCQIIADAPTIKPERKKGKWIPVMNGRGGHCCNRCNGYAPSYMNGDEHLSDFCPNCGADMRGTLDDQS